MSAKSRSVPELIKMVRKSVTIDWNLRDGARAKIRVIVKRILNKWGYPPDLQEEAVKRKKRKQLAKDGKLVIIAADHPARLVTGIGEDKMKMADRLDYLSMIVSAVMPETSDGVEGSPDVVDELLIINYLLRKETGKSFLDGKLLMGSFNRGGLAGTVFELDDTMTGYDAEGIRNLKLDGAKMMVRLNEKDASCGLTLKYCADAITDLNKYNIPVFL